MKGFQLFLHSVKQVFGNMGAAVRISGLLFMVQIAASVFLGGAAMVPGGAAGRGAEGYMILPLIVTLITGLWIAVAWHRYVLIVEEPTSIVPAFHGHQLLSYLGYSLLICLILIIPAVLLGALAGIIFKALYSMGAALGVVGSLIATLVILVPVMVIALRLSPVLPAAALGEGLGIRGAWASTEGAAPDFLSLALIAGLASFLIDLPLFAFMSLMPLAMLWAFLTSWVKMMVGASILTTVYGHYIQKRPLSA